MAATPHHRLSRRSSAELLRKNHPYSSSTDDDSDSGKNNVERDESHVVPQLPPRRAHGNSKRNSSNRPNPDGSLSSNGDKSLEEVRYCRSRTPDFGIDCSKVFVLCCLVPML